MSAFASSKKSAGALTSRPAPAAIASTTIRSAPTRSPASPERIRARAYEIYLKRCNDGQGGDALSDWLQAERELNGNA